MRRSSPSLILVISSLSKAFVPVLTVEKSPSTTCQSSLTSTTPLKSSFSSTNQKWDVDLYQKHSFVFEYGSSLIDLLDPQPGQVVLDVGCGSGQLTQEIAARGATAIGFDADSSMVQRAQESYPDLEFFQADVTNLEWTTRQQVDAIFSNAALHWVKNADAAVASMSRVLKPGGKLVVELGGKGNVERIVKAANQVLGDNYNPWYFPSIAEYATLLEAHDIQVVSAALFDRPTELEDGEAGMANWIRMFGGRLLQDVPEARREQVIEEIVSLLKHEEASMFDGKTWTADYRRLRIVARKLGK